MTKLVSRVGVVYFVVGYLVGCLLFTLSHTILETHRPTSVHSRYTVTSNVDFDESMEAEDGAIDGETQQNDRMYHQDDNTSQAETLARNIRILCSVMTSPVTLRQKEAAVLRTWPKRCNKMIFMSEAPNPNFTEPLVVLDREPDTQRMMTAFDYIYEHYVDDADWFLNVGDGTYVIVENLRYLLVSYDSSQPVYLGGEHQTAGGRYYGSRGTSYILSKKALQTFGEREKGVCEENKDLAMANCLNSLGVRAADSRDILVRDRFHYLPPVTRATGKHPKYFLPSNHHGQSKGVASMSDYSVSFHNIPLWRMEEFEYLVYHLRAYGIIHELQRLNGRNH